MGFEDDLISWLVRVVSVGLIGLIYLPPLIHSNEGNFDCRTTYAHYIFICCNLQSLPYREDLEETKQDKQVLAISSVKLSPSQTKSQHQLLDVLSQFVSAYGSYKLRHRSQIKKI